MGKRVTSFDLVAEPWLPAQGVDGATTDLSLLEVFARAHSLRRLVGDVPTQEFALVRLLLAILYDAVDGPADVDEWRELWEADEPFAAVPDYLERHRERFDLLHPTRPFFQVADLRTGSDEVSSLNRIVADVPNGEPFFTMRQPHVARLSFAEAARWLVHAHAFDSSGIKSGAVGDPRVKGGKGYPQGVGWAGNLGGVMIEGSSLRETLLLNLVAGDNDFLRSEKEDLPAWRQPDTPGPAPFTPDPSRLRPSGPRDLYTWQSRRVRLHHTADEVTGVVLSYGDALTPHNRQHKEPMTGWRRSRAQEKKLKRHLVYLPRGHDPARAAWRGLASLLFPQSTPSDGSAQKQEGADSLTAGVVQWVARLTSRYEAALPRGTLIRTRVVGAAYGTQQSVIDEMVDDGVLHPVVLLHEEGSEYRNAAVKAVADADAAVRALGQLAGNLARAAGSDPAAPTDSARDLGFGALDGPYRRWLRELGTTANPTHAREVWQRTAHQIIRDLGRRLLDAAGPATWEGRYVETADHGKRWVDDTQADLWFRRQLNRVLPAAAPSVEATPTPNDPTESTA
ncbi:type I-E CRISPR-associated protein Cse1/CasA [Streptomyces hainanensis]|uniref:Type I-E CRISPR-associated protein Cse1/CasA n=2 Tax=Streptomyces hainanensis TaxID=402648 RepID=A0A4R4THU3_9ACTN|nr:type I-E CRISPR-associated protein Cse1/CasA [Streptomyces hainanensis]